MTRPSEASVVPIRLTVDGRSGLTLWATPWEEDGEEWQAFLGSGQRVLVFGTPQELADYLRSDPDNDLSDHPQWAMLITLPPDQLQPEEGYDLNLDDAYDLASSEPDPYTVSDLSDLVDIVQRMAECCDEGTLLRLVEDTPEFAELLSDEVSYAGTDGGERWTAVGKAIDRSWELLLARLQSLLEWRGEPVYRVDADEDADDEDEDEDDEDDSGGPGLNGTVDRGGRSAAARQGGSTGPATQDDPARSGPDGEQYDVWAISGITPIQLTVPAGTGYTLRTYAGPDEEATFLGSDMTVDVFRTAEGLALFCREETNHDLAEMVTWPDIQEASSLPVEADEEEIYDLGNPTPGTLELVRDIAEYCQLEGVVAAVGEDTDTPPADWDAVLNEVSSCLRWHD